MSGQTLIDSTKGDVVEGEVTEFGKLAIGHFFKERLTRNTEGRDFFSYCISVKTGKKLPLI